MARERGMIEPFEERQVRDGVISYGLSSYGYDIRVANEFRIFTNVYTATVDPKNFDQRSFVEHRGATCIVPPNSFALARSVEYFRIPRSVLTVCVGKSTYARCFHGDTRVALVDASAPTLEEMTERAMSGEEFWGYSIGTYGRVIVTRLEAPRFVDRDQLIEVVLDNGSRIACTPDHEFLLRDGRLASAADLRPGHSLMPLYREIVRGYESVYQPLNGHLVATHRLADEWNIRNGIYPETHGTHRHHRNLDRSNNNPWNIERIDASEHIRMHNSETYGPDFDPAAHGRAIREALARRAKDPQWRSRFSLLQRNRALRFWNDDEAAVLEALEQAGSIRGAVRLLECDRSMFRRFSERIADKNQKGHNHRVEKVRELPGVHDVYCLSVPEAGNFALEAGLFVRNCGIIVNVTPFEPEWEGHVTLEISNTTPLPAKIYADEGIAQVLFFEADEPCELSYADRGGKYQAQRGVTLPRL